VLNNFIITSKGFEHFFTSNRSEKIIFYAEIKLSTHNLLVKHSNDIIKLFVKTFDNKRCEYIFVIFLPQYFGSRMFILNILMIIIMTMS